MWVSGLRAWSFDTSYWSLTLDQGLIRVDHTGIRLAPQKDRVITKPFLANVGAVGEWDVRVEQIADRILAAPQAEVEAELERLRSRFRSRHRDVELSWERSLAAAANLVPLLGEVADPARRQLLGAAFTQEYAIEGAALTNPSAVPVGDGEWIVEGSLRIDEVAEATGFAAPEGDYETIAGFVLARLGRIPDPGDSVEHDGWAIEVLRLDRHRIERLRLGRSPEPAPVADEAAGGDGEVEGEDGR